MNRENESTLLWSDEEISRSRQTTVGTKDGEGEPGEKKNYERKGRGEEESELLGSITPYNLLVVSGARGVCRGFGVSGNARCRATASQSQPERGECVCVVRPAVLDHYEHGLRSQIHFPC